MRTISHEFARRSDMFPRELCKELSVLHAAAPEHGWEFTKKSVEESLGGVGMAGSIEEIFETFEERPIASGSIAQVHRARVRDDDSVGGAKNNNRKSNDRRRKYNNSNSNSNNSDAQIVAIKVRHPNVAKLIDMDFRLMHYLATLIDCIPPLRWLDLKSSVGQFSATMSEQTRLDVEGYHLDVLNRNFR